MKGSKWFHTAIALVLSVGLVAQAIAQVEATVIVSNAPTAFVGGNVVVNVNIANVNDLYGWQLDLGFAPSILTANVLGPTEGSFLTGGGSTFFIGGKKTYFYEIEAFEMARVGDLVKEFA